jgi:hypothetical protein
VQHMQYAEAAVLRWLVAPNIFCLFVSEASGDCIASARLQLHADRPPGHFTCLGFQPPVMHGCYDAAR